MKYSLDIFSFLKGFLVFLILFFPSISLHYSLKKAFLSLLALLLNFACSCIYLSLSPLAFASLLFSAICKTSSYNDLTFSHFFFFGMVLVTASCTMLWTSIQRLRDLIICWQHKWKDFSDILLSKYSWYPPYFSKSIIFDILILYNEEG